MNNEIFNGWKRDEKNNNYCSFQLVVMLVVYSFFVCLDQSVKDFVRVEIFQILK